MAKRQCPRRYRIKMKNGKSIYAQRRKDGTFAEITNIGRSIAADRRTKARYHPTKSGQGHKGDYAKKRIKRRKK